MKIGAVMGLVGEKMQDDGSGVTEEGRNSMQRS